MNQGWRTVRVFISSTFRDMQSERDWLVRFVFPKLRQELLQRRIHLVDVDLRWGVTTEQDALSVCREVVDECRPRFLCMLGGRYGWVPPGRTRSITADEVHYGVLDREFKSRGFAYFYFRDPSATVAMVEVTPGEFREPAGSHGAVALDELKTAIVEAGLQLFIYRAQWDDQSRRLIGLKEFGDRVYADLKQSIDQEFGPATGETLDEFTEENEAMEAFIEERVQRFVLGSRQTVWNELQHHAESTSGNGYLCLTGAAGSGKSALLGKFCQDYRAAHPQDLVIPHFVGASPGSTDVRRTLRRLCHELVTGTALTAEIPEDLEKLRVAFAEILRQTSTKKRVVILLDAINQFDSIAQLAGWSWLPEELPANTRIIFSTLSGPTLDSLRQRRQPPRLVELQPLDASDREAIIREFLHRYRKSMTDDQRAALLAKADAGTPLYLLVALEELRTLGTYEEITDRIAQLPPDTQALFIWILKRLEDDDGFRDASGRKIGRELVSLFVSLLGASRHGLSQQELVELLSSGDPQGNVAALTQLLRPYLMQRGDLLDFYHGQFREAATTADLPSESQGLAAHNQLATYFRDKADPEKDQSWKGSSPRPCREVVYHLIRCERHVEASRLLKDLTYLDARISLVGRVNDLFTDYDSLRSLECNALEDWKRFLLRHASRLNRYPTSLFSVACLEGNDQVAAAARQMVDAGCWPKPWVSARRIYTVDAKQENIRNERTRSLDVIAENSTTIGPNATIAPEAGIALVGAGHSSLMAIDLLGRRENVLLPCTHREPRHLSFSADEARLAIADNTGIVELFEFQAGDAGRDWGLLPLGGTTCHMPAFRALPITFHGHLAIVRATADAELTVLECRSVPPTELRRIHCIPADESNPTAIVTLGAALLVLDDRQVGTCISIYATSELSLFGTLEVASRFLVARALHGNTFAVAYADNTLRVYHAAPEIRCVAEITHTMHVAEFCRGDEPGSLLFIDRHGQMFEWKWKEQTLPTAVQTPKRFVAPIGLACREDSTYVMLTREGGIHFRLAGCASEPNATQIVGVLDSPRECYVLLAEKDVTTLTTTDRDWTVPMGTDQTLSALLAYADRGGLLAITHPGSRGYLVPVDKRTVAKVNIQAEVTSAEGDAHTGFWLAALGTSILHVDFAGVQHAHNLAAFLPSQALWSRIHVCGDVIVWCGRCVCSGEFATEDSYIILFFRILPGQKQLTLVGQRTGIGRGAFLAGISHLCSGRTIVLLWKHPTSVAVTTGSVADYVAHTETWTEIQGIEDRPRGLVAVSAANCVYIIGVSALYFIDARKWLLQAVLPTSVPITDMSSLVREDGEVVLVLGQTEVLRCRCIMPRKTGVTNEYI